MLLLAVLCLVPVSLAAPHKCCAPTKFTSKWTEVGATVNVTSGVATPQNFMSTIYYDFDRKMMRLDRVSIDGGQSYNITMDYSKMMSYYMQDPNICIPIPMTDPMSPNCLPDNATYHGRQVFGSYDHHVMADTWEIDMGHREVKLMITPDTCIPLLEHVVVENGPNPMVQTMVWSDFTEGVDEQVFHLPSNCRHS